MCTETRPEINRARVVVLAKFGARLNLRDSKVCVGQWWKGKWAVLIATDFIGLIAYSPKAGASDAEAGEC